MQKYETNFLLLIATTVVAIVGVSYFFGDKKKNKVQFTSNKDGFEKDSENLNIDIVNLGKDFQSAKEKVFNYE